MAVATLGVLTVVSAAAAIWFFFRGRRDRGIPPEAVYQLLHAVSAVREHFSEEAAERLTERLRVLLDCVAVGIADAEGGLLSWTGAADHHYVDLVDHIKSVFSDRRTAVVAHDDLSSSSCRSCGMGVTMLVPLIVDGEPQGSLIVAAKSRTPELGLMVDVVAEFVRVQLDLGRRDESAHALQIAEIKALRAQISPHFLYNALNGISGLIRTDPDTAQELMQDFADFARYSFRTSGMFTTLAEEFRNIDRYLTIHQALYAGRLGVRMKIAPEVLSVVVPFLVLQPLVENAVKHGLAGKPGGGTVTIIANDSGDEAVISVDDDGLGMDPERLRSVSSQHKTGQHIGLGNVNARMQQTFGSGYALMVETAEGAGTKVTLRLPKFMPGVQRKVKE
ncbi:sensor histidine kinase, partial [Amycolatopsis orientalis]|uniref:sensor histidine kinase n=1 Tax=Amycolatopsis orientalis TaxID=31958 RepID=UPI000408D603